MYLLLVLDETGKKAKRRHKRFDSEDFSKQSLSHCEFCQGRAVRPCSAHIWGQSRITSFLVCGSITWGKTKVLLKFIFKNHAKIQLSLNIRTIKSYRLFENRKYLPLVTCFNSKPFFLRLHKFFVHGYLHVQSIFVLQKILVFVLLLGNILQQFLYLILFIRYLGVKYTV